MNEKEKVELRIKFLKQFDDYVRNTIGDDEITYYLWCAEGVPDGADEDDYRTIATDEDLWLETAECFRKCCRLARRGN